MIKNLVGVFILFPLFVSCGKNDHLSMFGKSLEGSFQQLGKTGEQIGRIPRIIGNKILGTSEDSDENIKDLQKEIDSLKENIEELKQDLNYKLTLLSNYDNDTSTNLNNLLTSINQNNSSLTVLQNDLNSLDTLLNDFINGYAVKIDPCGDNPNKYDEIILKLYDGTLLAVFKEGEYFMSVLTNGNYQTTDKQKCNFTVNNGNVTW